MMGQLVNMDELELAKEVEKLYFKVSSYKEAFSIVENIYEEVRQYESICREVEEYEH